MACSADGLSGGGATPHLAIAALGLGQGHARGVTELGTGTTL